MIDKPLALKDLCEKEAKTFPLGKGQPVDVTPEMFHVLERWQIEDRYPYLCADQKGGTFYLARVA